MLPHVGFIGLTIGVNKGRRVTLNYFKNKAKATHSLCPLGVCTKYDVIAFSSCQDITLSALPIYIV